MAEAIEIVQEAFIQLSTGEAIVPIRTPIEVTSHNGIALFMPAYLSRSDALGVKVVSVFPDNARLNRSTISALVVINDATTGEPRAVLEGSYLTAVRTGAASGVATQLLARPDAEAVAIFGAGVQGRTQLEAVCEVRSIRRAWIFDISRNAGEHFANEMGRRGGRIPSDIQVATTPAAATRAADIICTATTSSTPVIAETDLKPGVHINGIGSFKPEMQEVDEATVQRALLVVDSREAAWAEAGDLIIPRDKGLIKESDVYAELGEIALGQKSGRSDKDQITFFKAVGSAVQDVSVADYLLQKAEREGLGITAEI
jgi:ornithine cyclodeaminase/alanine dehydrogenase-like protein (mu-crystallin family)